MAQRDLRAASAAGLNPSDKAANLTLANVPYLGVNALSYTTTSDSTWRAARSVTNKSSGKWVFLGIARTPLLIGGTPSFLAAEHIGFGNSSATLNNYIGSDGNAYGVDGGGAYHSGLIGSTGSNWIAQGPCVVFVAIDLDASPARGWFRQFNLISGTDPGWRDFSNTAADPTSSSTGTDISSIGTPVYFISSSYNNGTMSENLINTGGWPLPGFFTIPSGYSMPDANYPFSMPSGVYKFTGSGTSANGMQVYVVTPGGSDSVFNTSAAIQTSGLKFWAVYWDAITVPSDGGCSVGIYNIGTTSSVRWKNDGTTTGFTGSPAGPTWKPGDVTYLCADQAAGKAWIKVGASGTWFGNGASPDPGTGTDGAAYSIGTTSNNVVDIVLNNDTFQAATLNAGSLTDSVTLPTGATWLETGAVTSRSRGFLLP